MKIQFGWRIPDFPTPVSGAPASGADSPGAELFRSQIFNFLDVLHGNFDAAWVGDHFFPWMDTVDQRADTIEAWTTLTYVMARYPKLRGGSIVLSQGYRPPALLAKMAMDLHWLSGGRLIFGIGAGWKENEYRAYGYDYPSDGTRLAQLAEAVQLIRAMWTAEAPRFSGQYYHVEDAYANPRQLPLPPLLIGGHGRKKTLRLVAQYADWSNFNNVNPAEFKSLDDTLLAHCQAVGRDPNSILRSYSVDGVAVAQSESKVRAMLQASPFGQWDHVSGTPGQIIDQLRAFVDLGARHIILRFVDFPRTDGAELFIKEVLPAFQS